MSPDFAEYKKPFLASLEAFWRTKNIQRENYSGKTGIVTIDLMATLAGQNFRKINLKEGY